MLTFMYNIKYMEKKPKNKGGRPTDYRPEYCQKLIEHMKSGLSYQSFPAVIGCAIDTIYNWEEKHPEFLDAKKQAFDLNRIFWDRLSVDIAAGINTDGNVTALIFNLKNRFPKEWRDRHEIQQEIDQKVKAEIELKVNAVDLEERVKSIKGEG